MKTGEPKTAKGKKKKTNMDRIVEIAKAARKAGTSYGKYVAKHKDELEE